jgi:hypothetical protein
MDGRDVLVRVHHTWHGWRSAEVRMGDLQRVHWFQPPGAPHPLLHAVVSCSDIVTGDIPHDCASTPGRHRLLVCVLKRHALASIYVALSRMAAAEQSPAVGSHPAATLKAVSAEQPPDRSYRPRAGAFR